MKEMISKAVNRLTAFIVKGLIEHVYDGDEMQLVKVSTTANEVIDKVERVQPYGLSTVPPKESEAIVLFLNGDKTDPVVVACDSAANRPTGMSANDTVVYSAHGQRLTMDNSGESFFDNGSDYVAMSAKVDAKIAALDAAIQAAITAAAPIASPSADGGTAGFTAFKTALDMDPNWTLTAASTNLRADG